MSTSTPISLDGLNKAAVLAALYNAAKPQGFGFLHYTPEPMTLAHAQEILDDCPCQYFDYLEGRILKIDLAKQELNPWYYNRDNGDNAAEQIIAALRTQAVQP